MEKKLLKEVVGDNEKETVEDVKVKVDVKVNVQGQEQEGEEEQKESASPQRKVLCG